LTVGLGNPSSPHQKGRAARAALDDARRRVARALGCEPGEVVFTASGSEAGALGLWGTFAARRSVSPRVLVSAVEHPCLREAAALRALGAEVVTLPVDARGVLKRDVLEAELARGAAVMACMWANNETGAVQPIAEVAALARAAGVPLLSDAVQAAGRLDLGKPLALADLVSISAHKFHGPHGAGALLVRRGHALVPLTPGHQERGRRGGTEDVAAACGLALALELALEARAVDSERICALRDRFEAGVQARFPSARIHAAAAPRLPNTSSLCFPGADGEGLLMALDLEGVCVSLGAACASGALSPSHVLLAMGVGAKDARSSLRFSFGRGNTDAEVDVVLDLLAKLVPRCGG
jgi:cysteine desulfurase